MTRLPIAPCFLFGMGNRRKLLYRRGRLQDLFGGELVCEWRLAREHIAPEEYSVTLELASGCAARIAEDEEGVWIEKGEDRRCVAAGPITLPRFDGHPRAGLLRRLHHEVTLNIVSSQPVPNLLAYSRAWYRDAAMAVMCLERTGNLHLVEEWIARLDRPFDLNNAGCEEPDNLGQALYLISRAADARHPLVPVILDAVQEHLQGRHLVGLTDFGEHPVYQTRWLKLGLRSLGLEDPYEVPDVPDDYGDLFWMDGTHEEVPPTEAPVWSEEDGFPYLVAKYPYLDWARAHYYRRPPPLPVVESAYPLTWETDASQAEYTRMAALSPECAALRISTPHIWHAAEMFLYFHDLGDSASPGA